MELQKVCIVLYLFFDISTIKKFPVQCWISDVPLFKLGVSLKLTYKCKFSRAFRVPKNGIISPFRLFFYIYSIPTYLYFLDKTIVLNTYGCCTSAFLFVSRFISYILSFIFRVLPKYLKTIHVAHAPTAEIYEKRTLQNNTIYII